MGHSCLCMKKGQIDMYEYIRLSIKKGLIRVVPKQDTCDDALQKLVDESVFALQVCMQTLSWSLGRYKRVGHRWLIY